MITEQLPFVCSCMRAGAARAAIAGPLDPHSNVVNMLRYRLNT